VARTDRPKAPLTVTGEAVLERDERAATSTQAYALRCRIVLACAEPGSFSTQVAAGLGVSVPTVMKWRGRFIDRGLPGLDGTVISELHRRHRAAEYLKFLRAIDKAVPAELDVHHRLRQPPGPQNTRREQVDRPPPPLPRPLHPDRIVLDQPGGTLVRLPHHPEAPAQRPQIRPGPRSRRPTGPGRATTTRDRSYGRKPPRRSSSPSPDICNESQARRQHL
jgi:hypothetical protein